MSVRETLQACLLQTCSAELHHTSISSAETQGAQVEGGGEVWVGGETEKNKGKSVRRQKGRKPMSDMFVLPSLLSSLKACLFFVFPSHSHCPRTLRNSLVSMLEATHAVNHT